MARSHYVFAACLALSACGSGDGTNPVTGGPAGSTPGGGGGLTSNTIPANLAGNVSRIAYDPNAGTLSVEVTSLDSSTQVATYARNASLDVPGYTAFSFQDDPLDRMFIALAAASADGSVQAGIVSDGGQFNEYYAGGYYARTGTSSIPTSGLVSYAGTYAGITNGDVPGGPGLLPVPPGTPPSITPGQALQTAGDVYLNVSFSDNSVNGAIINRRFIGVSGSLADIALNSSDIDTNGEFLGTAEFLGDPSLGAQGDYGGIIGGTNASSIAGVIALNNIFLPTDPRDTPFDREIGVFVLPRCGTAAATSSLCTGVNP